MGDLARARRLLRKLRPLSHRPCVKRIFRWTEWIPVISSAFATGFLIVPLIMQVTRRFLDLCLFVMIGQALVGDPRLLVSLAGQSR